MNSTKEKTAENVTTEKQNNIELGKKNCNFSEFVRMFTEDSVFQKEHVKFPLEVFLLGTDYEDEDSVLFVKETEWRFVNFKDSIIDGIKYIYQVDAVNCTVTKLGYDTGINIDYYFCKSGKQWQLIKIEDWSN